MLSWTGQGSLSEQMSRRVRAVFGAVNFWAIIMYNLVTLNSLEFTELVARRLLLTGKGRGGGDTHRTKQQPGGLWPFEMPPPHHNSLGTQQGGPTGWERPGERRVTEGVAAPRHPWPLPSTGFPQTTLAILFVTYCGVQLVKERERTLALEEQKQDKLKPE